MTHIRSAYRAEEFVVAKNVKEFKKGQHDGVIHNGELCLRGDALRKLFPNVRVEDIAINLSAQGAFRTGKDSLQIQLSGANGARFYAIPLNKLQ